MKRLFKWGCLTIVLLVVVLVGTTVYQLRALQQNLAEPAPLDIPGVELQAEESDRIAEVVDRQTARPSRTVSLTGAEATYLLGAALAGSEAQRALREASAQLATAAVDVPSFLGGFEAIARSGLRLEALRAAVEFEDDRFVIRATAPYADGQTHLNVVAAGTGAWVHGETQFALSQLQIGQHEPFGFLTSADDLESMFGVDLDGWLEGAEGDTGDSLIEAVRIEGGRLVATLAAGRERALGALVRSWLAGG